MRRATVGASLERSRGLGVRQENPAASEDVAGLEWSWSSMAPTSPDAAFAARPQKHLSGGETAAQYTQQVPSVQLDLDVYAGRKIKLHERIHRLVGGVQYVHQPLVRAQLKLIARVLIAMRRHEERKALHLGRQRHGTLHRCTGALGGLDDFTG